MKARLGSSAEEVIKGLASIGPRPAGSAGLQEATFRVADQLQAMGLNISVHEFLCTRWEVGSPPRLTVQGVGELSCEAMLGSIGGSFSGRLEPYGNYVVWGMYSWPAYAVRGAGDRLEAHLLVRPDGSAIQQPVPEGSALVPHLCVGVDAASALESCAATGGRVEGSLETVSEGAIGHNVRAWRGKDLLFGDGRVDLVVAHCDTVPSSPGAYDNAGGVAALLGLAELLAEAKLPEKVQLLLTGAEEQHLAGSRAFVKELRLAGKLANVGFCLNLDGTGRGEMLEAWVGPGALAERIRKSFKGEDARFVSPPPSAGDHYSFWESGVPAVMLTFNDPEILHRPEDVPDPRKVHNARKMTVLAARVLTEMAMGSD